MAETTEPSWQIAAVHALGRRVADHRKRRKMTVLQLAERMAELGSPVDRRTLASLERGERDMISVYEVVALAAALNVSPMDLIWSVGTSKWLEVLPGTEMPPLDAVTWFCAEPVSGRALALPPTTP